VTKPLHHDAAWTIAGNVVYAACQLGMLAILAKIGTATDVGALALGLAVATPVTSLCMMQLRALQITDVRDQVPFGDYLGLRLWGMAAALLLIAVIAVGAYDGAALWTILGLGLAKAIEALSDVAFGALQRRGNMRLVAISQIAKGLLSLVAIALPMYVTGNVAYCGFALAVAWTITLLAIDLPGVVGLKVALAPNLGRARLVPLVHAALPLGIVTAILTLSNAVPRLVLDRSHGLAAVGLFAPLMTLILPGTITVGAIGQAASPRLASAWDRGERAKFASLVRGLLLIAIAVGVLGVGVAVVAGHWALRILFSRQIAAGSGELTIVMIAGAVTCVTSVLGVAATASRRRRLQPVATGIALAVMIATALVLVPSYDVHGAVIAALASALVLCPLYVAVLRFPPDPDVA
jgi:O-antigen/teichoic acid export membrane protein